MYSGITQLAEYKDLVKANGHLNLELAKSIASTREFEGDGKKAFESLIKAEENYEAALKQMDDYLGGIFGNYATDIMDVVADAFERVESLRYGENPHQARPCTGRSTSPSRTRRSTTRPWPRVSRTLASCMARP